MKKPSINNPNCFAGVRTGRGAAAIGSVELAGPGAEAVVRKLFTPTGSNADFSEGSIIYGRFVDDGQTIDDGIVGIEGPERFALHCHGNPLILEQILRLAQRHGAQIVPYEQMLTRQFKAECSNAIEAEAKLECLKSVSLLGVQIIQNQSMGLTKIVAQWLQSTNLDSIRCEAKAILARSAIARRIIRGVTIVLAGPPNSGKSTLLNHLAGREQALVSDTAGTTRDWVTAAGRIEPLYIEWIDTAGMDELLARPDELEQAAQQRTKELLSKCDLILYILDATQPMPKQFLTPPNDIPILMVLNKCDLQACLRMEDLPDSANPAVMISAKDGTGIETLTEQILKLWDVKNLDPALPITFTDRQVEILEKILTADQDTIKPLCQRLLDGIDSSS